MVDSVSVLVSAAGAGDVPVPATRQTPTPNTATATTTNANTNATPSSTLSPGSPPIRDDAILSVAKVLHRHILHSRAEALAREQANKFAMRTPRIGSGGTGGGRNVRSQYGSTHSTPILSRSSAIGGGFDSPMSGHWTPSPIPSLHHSSTPGGASVSSSLSSCLNSPAVGSPYSSLATPPQMPLDLDSRPHRYEEDVFDIDHYLARSYAVQVPLITRVIPISVYAQKRQYHVVPVPNVTQVHKFIKRIFDQARLNAECVIIALIYIERAMETRSLVLTSRNWIPVVSTALLTASKIQDDHSSFNAEFAAILPIFTLQQVNSMERVFLTTLSYELYISSSVYAQYYFGLRTLTGVPDPTAIPRYYQTSMHADAAMHAASRQVEARTGGTTGPPEQRMTGDTNIR